MGRLSIDAIDHIVINVRDVEVSVVWYAQVLGMTRQDQRGPSGEIRTSMSSGEARSTCAR